MRITEIPNEILAAVKHGIVIPAHPLALTPDRGLDERHQRALTRYYIDAGAGGIAIGAGALFGVIALRQNASSAPHCTGNVCDAEGVSLRDSAVSSGTLSTIGFVGGVALLGAGVSLYFLEPNREARRPTIGSLEVHPGLGQLDVRATW